MIKNFLQILIVCLLLSACMHEAKLVTTASLLQEMTDLSRLTFYSGSDYRTVQFSSYDRRSTRRDDPDWYANEDGFGNEPLPAFEKVLKEPDEQGIGEYLICDIQQPGAILRLWTARIQGNIRFYIDNITEPVYEGNAEDFFWKTIDILSENNIQTDSFPAFRQSDAVYFPIPFASRCRIEWTGNISETHFYHIGVRLYKKGTIVESFSRENLLENAELIKEINSELLNSVGTTIDNTEQKKLINIEIPSSTALECFNKSGSGAIEGLSFKIKANDYESVLRKNVLRIWYDNAVEPQVEAPLGDFFASAPGITPYRSFPFSMKSDSVLLCRFIMPFRRSVRMEIENYSDEDIRITGEISTAPYDWEMGISMHFHAKWKMDYNLTAQNINDPASNIQDIVYLETKGKGRIVGAAALVYNPTNVPTSWGNWWGEGDEKIFIDQDTFPSFFGTGSEDYFNYSWSSASLFSYPYSGQPRNDGPGNRGYVSNYRWHILDDIPFSEKVSFYMELGHHGKVPGFNYGRIVYYYSLPGSKQLTPGITREDLHDINYKMWSPEAYEGSAGYDFTETEELISIRPGIILENDNLCSHGSIIMWHPAKKGEKISFMLRSEKPDHESRIGFTLLHTPEGGKFSLRVNGEALKIGGMEVLDLNKPNQSLLDNHFSELFVLEKGDNND